MLTTTLEPARSAVISRTAGGNRGEFTFLPRIQAVTEKLSLRRVALPQPPSRSGGLVSRDGGDGCVAELELNTALCNY